MNHRERLRACVHHKPQDGVDDLPKLHSGSLSSLRGTQICYGFPHWLLAGLKVRCAVEGLSAICVSRCSKNYGRVLS